MDYPQTIDWLYERLPMFQKLGEKALKFDLSNISDFMLYLGNPHQKFKSIHVAGTNGKGSTSHMLASILQESGYQTALTTSPHLVDFRERIRINGQMADKAFVVDFVEKHKAKILSLQASFFEVTIAMAFTYFAENNVDVAVIETGLGGRLDSTNIISPLVSVITNIGLDHTHVLGDTLAKIAAEKAGIIKPNVPVVIGEMHKETKAVFELFAKKNQAKLIEAEQLDFKNYESDLKGFYQEKNKKTVLATVEVLKTLGYEIKEENIQNGLLCVAKNTGLRGRWEILANEPLIVADTAHNPHGLSEISKQIKSVKYQNLILVLGFVNDKDVQKGLSFFPEDAIYHFTQPNLPRKFPVDELKNIVSKNLNAKYFYSVQDAIEAAKKLATKDDMIYIGGSTFVVAEAIS